MDGISEEAALLILATLLGLISTAVVAAVRYARRVIRTLDKLEDNVLPYFAPPKPGEPDESLPAHARHAAEELSYNSGKSVKDLVRKIDGTVSDHERRLSALESRPLHEGA